MSTSAEIERDLLALSSEARKTCARGTVADHIALAAMTVNMAGGAHGKAVDETRASLAHAAARQRVQAETDLKLARTLDRAVALLSPHKATPETRGAPPDPADHDPVALYLSREAKRAKSADPTWVLVEGWARLPQAERATLSNVAALLAMAERHIAHELALGRSARNRALVDVLRRLVKHVVGRYVVGVFSLADVADEQRGQDQAMAAPQVEPIAPGKATSERRCP